MEPLKGDLGCSKPCALVTGAGRKEPVWGEDHKVAVMFRLELVQEEGGKGFNAESHYKLNARERKMPYPERNQDAECLCTHVLHSH